MKKLHRQRYLLFVGLIFLLWIYYCVPVLAASENPTGLEDTINLWLDDIFSGPDVATMQKLLVLDLSEYSAVIKELYNLILIIGVALLSVYFLIDIIQRQTENRLTLEILLQRMAVFFVGLFILNNGYEIFNELIKIGNAFFNSVFRLCNPAQAAKADKIVEAIKEYNHSFGGNKLTANIYRFIQLGMIVFIMWLLNFIMDAVVWLICLQRNLSLWVTVVVGAVALADVVAGNGNMNSNLGLKYMKKVFALASQGAIIVIIVVVSNWIYSAVCNNIFGQVDDTSISRAIDAIKYMGLYLVVAGSRMMLIVQSGKIAKATLNLIGGD